MKAFKKLMAAALVCVMALTVLTGCGVADKKTKSHMVDALNDYAKEVKASFTYENTDAMDSLAESAMKNAQKDKKIASAKLEGNYSIYTKKLTETWNSTSDLKSTAKAAHEQFVKDGVIVEKDKATVGVCVDKVDGDNYIVVVVKKAATTTTK